MRILNFSDGFSSSENPQQGIIKATSLHQCVDSDSFLEIKGSAVSYGDIFYNTTENKVSYYDGSEWVYLLHQDSSGNLVVENNLTVGGTTTYINTTNLEIKDKNILLNKEGNDSSAEGSGLSVQRDSINGSLVFDTTKASKWKAGLEGSEIELSNISSSQTLTNKTLDGSLNTITNISSSNVIVTPSGNLTSTTNQTALLELQTDIDTRATTADLSTHASTSSGVHGVSGSVVGTTNTQTLTNKTLTSPVISGGTINNASIGATTPSTGVFTSVDSAAITVASVPVVTTTGTQTLTNKTLTTPTLTSPVVDVLNTTQQSSTPANPSAGSTKVYTKTDGYLYTLDSTGVETQVGVGAGGNINFISNGDAETTATIFTGYTSNIANAKPVLPFSSNAPGLTITRTTTTPLYKTASWLLTKAASNTQGQNQSISFSVDPAFRAKVLNISFDYIVNSGTFAAGTSSTNSDLIVYIYDVTNNALIEPSSFKFLSNNSSLSDKFSATFQTSATGSSYRLILHSSTSSTSAFSIKIDNIAVSPSNYIFGTPITDWSSFTPTGSWTTNTTYTGKYRRVGDSIEVSGKVLLTGAPTATQLTLGLPSGLSIDTSKLPTSTSEIIVGQVFVVDNGVNAYLGQVTVVGGGIYTSIINTASTYGLAAGITATQPFTFGNTDYLEYVYRVPIQGWSSSVQTSSEYDGRIVSARLQLSAAQSVTSGVNTKVLFNLAAEDTLSGFNSANNRYDIKTPGKYSITFTGNSVGSVTAVAVRIYKNGVESAANTITASSGTNGSTVTTILDFIAGDYIEAYIVLVGTSPQVQAFGWTVLNIQKIAGNPVIAASESVTAVYNSSAGQSFASGSSLAVNLDNKVIDSHGVALTPSSNLKLSCPIAGKYELSGSLEWNSASWTAGQIFFININRYNSSGTFIEQRLVVETYVPATSTAAYVMSLSPTIFDMQSGDYLQIFLNQNSGTSKSLRALASANFINFKKVGN